MHRPPGRARRSLLSSSRWLLIRVFRSGKRDLHIVLRVLVTYASTTAVCCGSSTKRLCHDWHADVRPISTRHQRCMSHYLLPLGLCASGQSITAVGNSAHVLKFASATLLCATVGSPSPAPAYAEAVTAAGVDTGTPVKEVAEAEPVGAATPAASAGGPNHSPPQPSPVKGTAAPSKASQPSAAAAVATEMTGGAGQGDPLSSAATATADTPSESVLDICCRLLQRCSVQPSVGTLLLHTLVEGVRQPECCMYNALHCTALHAEMPLWCCPDSDPDVCLHPDPSQSAATEVAALGLSDAPASASARPHAAPTGAALSAQATAVVTDADGAADVGSGSVGASASTVAFRHQ